MITQALRRGFGARGNYNFEVSTTILDAPDPSGDDNARPWVKGGFIVGDPVITRVGSEWNSSFYTKDTGGEFWILEDIPQFFEDQWIRFLDFIILAPVTAVFPNVEYIRTEIIGLPIGRDRQAELELSVRSFGAYQGPLGNIRHKDVFAGDAKLAIESGIMWVDPANDARNNLRQPHPTLTNASEFAFTSSTHLGLLLTDPRGFDESSAVGFRTSATFADEEGCLAAATNNACGTPGTCGQQVTAAAGAESEARAFDGLVVRELVPDFDFRLVGGVVENARILGGPGMPNLKAVMPADFKPLTDFVTETAVSGWVGSGTWQRAGAVTLGGSYVPMVDSVQPFIGASTTASALEAELKALTNADMHDRVAAFSAAAAHMTGSGDSWVDIGVSGGNVKANLFAASLVAQQLLVRVEYDLGTATDAKVLVSLKGPGVSTSASWNSSAGTSRQVAELVVNRSGVFATGVDRITVSGTDVRVYAVSVRPAVPMQVSGSDSHFELVLLEAGTSPQRATALASRSIYQGKKGRLARFTSTTVLGKLEADVRAWVDGSSATGAAGSFAFAKAGGIVPDALWSTTTSFTEPRPRGAQAHTLPGKGLRLGHAHPSTSIAAQRVGFWVEYPATSSFARFVTEMSAMFGSDDASEGDDEIVIEAAGEPGCVSLVGLECFEDASPLD